MNVSLETKRPWNWKVFLVLTGMILVATFANIPFSDLITNSQLDSPVVRSWQETLVMALKDFGITWVLGTIGLLLSNRIGLGLPFVEAWARGRTVPQRLRCVAAIAMISAIVLAAVVLSTDTWVFGPRVAAMMQALDIPTPKPTIVPPLLGFLASFAAGIREEAPMRLFGISLVAFLGGLLFHDAHGRPRLAVLWTANLIFAVLFGLGHLYATSLIGLPINALIVARAIVLNSMAGLLFGWLYWTFGLESAMLAHFFADVVIYTLLPISRLPGSQAGMLLASAGMGLIVLLALAWALRTLQRERMHAPALQPVAARQAS